MARLDDLPADQRAVLSLLVKQGRGYAQIAGMLRLEPGAVRERALDALDALGPQDDALAAEDQDLVADHLLGQSDGAAREEAEALLAESPAARAWARAVAAELTPLAPEGRLPEIPDDPEPVLAPEPVAAGPEPAVGAGAGGAGAGAGSSAAAGDRPPRGGSRLGTGLIVGAALVAIVAVIVAVSGGFGGGSSSDDQASSSDAPVAASTPTTGTTTAAPARVQQQIELTSPTRGSEALGVAQLVASGSTRGLAVAARDLGAGFYAVWLYNSPTDAAFLGFAPQVSGTGSAKGQLQGLSQSLPSDITRFRRVVISRQTVTAANRNETPSRPGTVVLGGTLK